MSFEVLDPGWASRIVAAGRHDCRSLGVPIGGAADRTALAIGNALVGNPPDAAALEVCLNGPCLRATSDTACVVYGAPFDLHASFGGDSENRQTPCNGKTFNLHEGDELHIAGTPRGMRAYFCVRDGFDVPLVLGSRSALEPLRRGELLVCPATIVLNCWTPSVAPHFADECTLRALPGLQADLFEQDAFYRQVFTVGSASNRMGLRLQGQALRVPDQELVSEPVGPGAVQLTRDGQCVVLGVDGQTIGGYPKIAHVAQVDHDRIGQLRPGQRVRFLRIAAANASRLYREQHTLLDRWVLRLRAASR